MSIPIGSGVSARLVLLLKAAVSLYPSIASGKMDKPYTQVINPRICGSGWKMVRISPEFIRPGSAYKSRQPSSYQKAAGDCRCRFGLQDLPALWGLHRSSSVSTVVSYL